MGEKLRHASASAPLCLTASVVAFLGGGALLVGAVREIYGGGNPTCAAVASPCSSPSGLVVVALTAAGILLFALGATAWFRAVKLVAGTRRSRHTAV